QTLAMRCPHCKSRSVYEHGFKQKGQQPYVCEACQRTFRKRSFKGLWLGGLVALLGLSPWVLKGSLRAMVGKPDDGQPVDAIVVLGRGPEYNGERALVAAQLWDKGRASQIFISGMSDAPVMIKLLREMGVPEDKVRGERCSQSTWENGLFSEILLSPQAAQRILLVTDEAHMARSAMVFRGFGFEVVPHPTQSGFSVKQMQQILRESAGLITYGTSGKLRSPEADQVRRAEAEANYKIKKWNCSLPNQK
ncbi:MAG: ElyC/SanA/YdcF family protein, partial [Cyanobacteria bacterium P01_F01_bin.4]